MMLALHLHMTGPVDRTGDLTAAHQPRPTRIEARMFGPTGDEVSRLDALIRPESSDTPNDIAVRCGVRLLACLPLLADWNAAATHVLAHDMPETDWAMRVCRSVRPKSPTQWLRDPQIRVDTAVHAAALMGMEGRLPTLDAAARHLLGEAADGLDTVLALYSHEAVQRLRRVA
jgi:hypothetical protein